LNVGYEDDPQGSASLVKLARAPVLPSRCDRVRRRRCGSNGMLPLTRISL